MNIKMIDNKILRNNVFVYFILLAISLSFCYFCVPVISPLYAIQGGDSSVFELIGLSLLKGKIPYRDIFDHKGPIIYFINAVGQLISPGKNGIFILQFLNLSICTIIWYKLAHHYINGYRALLVILIILFTILIGNNYGNMTEDWSILFISIALLCTFRICKTVNEFVFDSIVIGVCFACVFFLRPNDAVSSIGGMGIGILCLHYKKWEGIQYLKFCGYVGLGILCITIPIVCYFSFNHAMNDFWYGLIKYNTLYTGGLLSMLVDCFSVEKYVYVPILIVTGLLIYINDKKLLWIFVPMYILSYLLLGSRCYLHYFTIWMPIVFLPFGTCMFRKTTPKSMVICAILIYFSMPIFTGKNIIKLPISQYKSKMRDLKSAPKDYSYDYYKGAETIFNIIPNKENNVWIYNPSFCTVNALWCNRLIPINRIPLSIMAEQDTTLLRDMDIIKHKPQYLIISENDLLLPSYTDRDSLFIENNYHLIVHLDDPKLALYEYND